jgi:hypothetical protein
MRASLWFLGISVVALPAAGGITAGCGSSSTPPATPTTTHDASTPVAEASCYVDASLTAYAKSDAAGAGCAACVNDMCESAIASCSTDCTCINLITCLLGASVSTMDFQASAISAISGCVPGGLTAAWDLLNNQAVKSVYNCFTVTCLSACSVADGGDAAAMGGGATDDTGAAPDVADGGAVGDAGPTPDAADSG